MKKLTMMIVLLVIFLCAWGKEDVMGGITDSKSAIRQTESRDVPEWSWGTLPMQVMSSYYDYMQGSYHSSPLKLQSADMGGIYMAFHAQENQSSERRVYYAYLNNGQLTTTYITANDTREGYCGMDVDKISGDAMFSWHSELNGDILDDFFAIDRYSIMQSPGLLTTPYMIVDNDETNEFNWPCVYITASPLGEPYRRIIVIASNSTQNGAGNANENPIFAYYDYTSYTELEALTSQDWHSYTITQFDTWREADTRPFYGMTVSKDGKIAFIGTIVDYTVPDEVAYPEGNKIFVVYNDNFGDEDSWETFLFEETIPIPNPDNYFEDDTTNEPYTDIRYSPGVTGHDNSVFDDQGRVHTNMIFDFCHEDNFYTIDYETAKHLIFTPPSNGNEAELEIIDVYPLDGNPDDEYPYLPWDPDGNGPQWEEDVLICQRSFPFYWWSTENSARMHEEYLKTAINGNWMVTMFGDCTKAYMYNRHGIDDYAAWAEAPEIYISVSNDYGYTWSEAITLNALETPELADMIPCYSYVCERITQVDETHGKLDIMFFDDNSYGSFTQGNGIENGGNIKYASIIVDFGAPNNGLDSFGYQWVGIEDNEISVSANKVLRQNSPNPFNPDTKISFNLTEEDNVELSVFNVKGQKIKTLTDQYYTTGEHSVNWNGTDDNNQSVSSGVYFYQIKTSDKSEIRKMVLMK